MCIMKDNPEKAMLFLFPLITFSIFLVAILLWWVIVFNPLGWW